MLSLVESRERRRPGGLYVEGVGVKKEKRTGGGGPKDGQTLEVSLVQQQIVEQKKSSSNSLENKGAIEWLNFAGE